MKKLLSNLKKSLPEITKGFGLEILIFIIFIFGIAVYDTFVKPGELMDREILEIGESIPEFKAPSTSGTIASEDLDESLNFIDINSSNTPSI